MCVWCFRLWGLSGWVYVCVLNSKYISVGRDSNTNLFGPPTTTNYNSPGGGGCKIRGKDAVSRLSETKFGAFVTAERRKWILIHILHEGEPTGLKVTRCATCNILELFLYNTKRKKKVLVGFYCRRM